MKIYKIVSSQSGFKELEKKVSMLLNSGWECVGGMAFNQGHGYQAMVIDRPAGETEKPPHKEPTTTHTDSYNQAARAVDELT